MAFVKSVTNVSGMLGMTAPTAHSSSPPGYGRTLSAGHLGPVNLSR